jgi:hypothetical protein
VESRTSDDLDLALLVHEVIVEQLAHLLGLSPEQVDPAYRDDG